MGWFRSLLLHPSLTTAVYLGSLASLGAACGSTILQVPTDVAATMQDSAGAHRHRVTELTDMETAYDVAVAEGQRYVATSDGVWLHGEGTPRRVEALGREAYVAVALSGTQGFAATRRQVVALDGAEQTLPDIGELVALHAEGTTFWAGGTTGLARRGDDGQWVRFGDTAQVTGFFDGAAGGFWVGTARGLLYIEGDVVEEHAQGRGLPAGYVRSAVSLGDKRVFALVQNADNAYLAYYDEVRWFTYTLDGFEQLAVGLGLAGSDILLLTQQHAIRIAIGGTGVPLVPLAAGDRLTALTYDGSVGVPQRTNVPLVATPRVTRLVSVPTGQPSVRAPGFSAVVDGVAATNAYRVWFQGGETYLADHHRGVAQLGRDGAVNGTLRTGTLIADQDLRMVTDERGRDWILTDEGTLGEWQGDHFAPQRLPDGLVPEAIAANDRGVYVAALGNGQVHVLRHGANGWERVDGRALLATPAEPAQTDGGDTAPAVRVVGLPHLAVRDDGEIWLGLRVEENGQARNRGVAVYRPGNEAVVYHHAAAIPETDGEGALRMPDNFNNIELGEEGMAWFSTLVGAVRLGNFQAVTFGEARGVRGEVVSDVLVGTDAKLWVAAAEGPGYYHRQRFEFRMPANVIATRPLGMALAHDGAVWGAGPSGLVRYDDGAWSVYPRGEIPEMDDAGYLDIEANGRGTLWVLGQRALWRLDPIRFEAESQ